MSGVTTATAPDTSAADLPPGDDAKAPTTPSPGSAAWLPSFTANAFIWGSSFVFIAVAVRQLHPTWVGAGRITVGALTLLAILLITGDRLPRDRKTWLHMLLPGILGTALPFTLFAYGQQRVDSVVAGIWNATTALWVLPIAVFVFRTEKFTSRAASGLGIGFVGVLMVLGFWQSGGGSSLTGQLMCGVAAICYGVAIPYIKRFITGRKESGVALAAAQLCVASVASLVAAMILSGPPPAPAGLSWQTIGSVLLLGAFGSGIAFALNMRVIAVAGASTAAYVTYLVPLVATLLGILVLNESLTWNLPVGAAIVLLGVAVAQGKLSRHKLNRRIFSRRRPEPAPDAQPSS